MNQYTAVPVCNVSVLDCLEHAADSDQSWVEQFTADDLAEIADIMWQGLGEVYAVSLRTTLEIYRERCRE